jgi:hypothetical protein
MKEFSEVLGKLFPPVEPYRGEAKEISYLIANGISVRLKLARMSSEMLCEDCKGQDGHVCLHDPRQGKELAWFCANRECLGKSSEISKELNRKAYKPCTRGLPSHQPYRDD